MLAAGENALHTLHLQRFEDVLLLPRTTLWAGSCWLTMVTAKLTLNETRPTLARHRKSPGTLWALEGLSRTYLRDSGVTLQMSFTANQNSLESVKHAIGNDCDVSRCVGDLSPALSSHQNLWQRVVLFQGADVGDCPLQAQAQHQVEVH